MSSSNMKALYIVVNAGFAEEIVELLRTKGASGATIINARGVSALHKEIMGISIDREKEVVLTIVNIDTADKIIEGIKQSNDLKTKSHCVCFALPVTNALGIEKKH